MASKTIYHFNRHTLNVALNFDFNDANEFMLYRRKDDRLFRFARYVDYDYKSLVEYLQDDNTRIKIPAPTKLRVNALYMINGKGKFQQTSTKEMPAILAENNFLVSKGLYYNMLVNYTVAKYVLTHYQGFTFRAMPEMNSHISTVYDSVETLETIPEDSFLRKCQVFLPCKRPCKVDVASIPEEVIDSYITTETFTHEYVTFTVGEKVGLRAWGIREIIPAEYKDIQVSNFVAYLQNEEGLWAEYNLKSEKFVTEFKLGDVRVIPSQGVVFAKIHTKEVILRCPRTHPLYTIEPGETGQIGLKHVDHWLIPPEYDYINVNEETGYYEVFKDDFNGLYTRLGTCLLPCAYEAIEAFGSQPELFKVCRDGKWGVVGLNGRIFHPLDIPHGDKKALEQAYKEAMLTYLREAHAQHRLIPTKVLKTNAKYGYILVELLTCNLRIKLRKKQLPAELFKQYKNGIPQKDRQLNLMALSVTDTGLVCYNYEQTQVWRKYKTVLKSFKVGKLVFGEVISQIEDGYTIRFKNGVHGILISKADKTYTPKECLQLKVERVEGEKVYLSEIAPTENADNTHLEDSVES